jgi:hypothetical protein
METSEVITPLEENVIKIKNSNEEFSLNKLKLLNLIAEIIINSSINEYYEKGY